MLHSGFNALLRPRSTRFYTQATSLVTHAAKPQSTQPTLVHYPYFVPRNTNGSLPVYTDIRNGGTRYMVLIRNIDGDANALASDLYKTLFQRGVSSDKNRLQIQTVRSKHLVITGGRWKNEVVEWLRSKGF